MASIVFSNFNDFVQRCKDTVVSNVNWEAMILKVLSGNSEFIVNQVPLTNDSQIEATPSTLSESMTSSLEMSLSHDCEENLDEKFATHLVDIKYHQIDVLSTIDERGEEAAVHSQSLITNEENRPLVQEEEESLEQLNNSLHWDFQSSLIDNQGHEENLEECDDSLMEDIAYVVPEMEIYEKDPIGEEHTAMQSILSNVKVKNSKLKQTSLNDFISDHRTVNAERQDHKDCTPKKTVKKRWRRHPYNKKSHLKDNKGTWNKKCIKKRKIGEVVQADMNKAPRKKLRMNITDDEKTREVQQVQQVQPYVLIPRLSKDDISRAIRLLRQRTFRSLNAKKLGSTTKGSYRCNICHQLLKNKHGLLRHHIYRHTDEKPYKCPHCPKTFKNYGDVKQHTGRVHTISGSYDTTPNKTLRISFTGEEKRKVSQVEGTGSCLPISYSSEQADSLDTVRSLRSRNCISADYAGSTAASSNEVQTGDGSKNYNWTVGRGRNVVSRVSDEKKSTRKVEETERQKDELDLELEKEHTTSNNNRSSSKKGYYCCDVCHQWLKHKKSLYRHIVYQHTDESKPFKCPRCPKSYTDSTNLKKHIRSKKHRATGS